MDTLATSLGASQVRSEAGLGAVVEHWAKSRIDSPLQVIARFDEAARQLIAVGALLQGAYLAVFGFSNKTGPIPLWALVLLFVPLFAMIFCAAKVVCLIPLRLETFEAYSLLKRLRDGIPDAELDRAMDTWCRSVDHLSARKRIWLHTANILFLIVSAATLLMVFTIAMLWSRHAAA